MTTIDSFIGSCKDIRLDVAEKQCIRAALFHTSNSTLEPMHPGQLFAYEKAVMFSALSGLVKDMNAPSPENPRLTIWHGNLFKHLQPFVLSVTRD
jgi:hypothetical protein